jgi:hypothetical protein
MADITMCKGTGCPIKEKCYRFTATESQYGQSYFLDVPGKIENDKFTCDMYWGDNAESIWNLLKDVTKSDKNDQ